MTTDILQDHSRESLRASLVQQLSAYSQNEDEFLRHAEYLAGTQGEKIYPSWILRMTKPGPSGRTWFDIESR
jgi:hypothetical protein